MRFSHGQIVTPVRSLGGAAEPIPVWVLAPKALLNERYTGTVGSKKNKLELTAPACKNSLTEERLQHQPAANHSRQSQRAAAEEHQR